MSEVFGIAIILALLGGITAWALVAERRRKSLFPDDGIVWNTEIEKRLEDKRG